jgi:hypothetical protein
VAHERGAGQSPEAQLALPRKGPSPRALPRQGAPTGQSPEAQLAPKPDGDAEGEAHRLHDGGPGNSNSTVVSNAPGGDPHVRCGNTKMGREVLVMAAHRWGRPAAARGRCGGAPVDERRRRRVGKLPQRAADLLNLFKGREDDR